MIFKFLRSACIVIAIFILDTNSLQAQDDFTKGFIVTLQGDTLNGYITVFYKGFIPYAIEFKESYEKSGNIYYPNDIKLFKTNGKIFAGSLVDIEKSPRDLQRLGYDPKLYLGQQLCFIEEVIGGNKPLYVIHYTTYDLFYIKEDTAYTLLVYKKYLKKPQIREITRDVIVENKKFIGQLKIYLADCPQLISAIENTTYDFSSLKSLFTKYQVYKNEKPVVRENRRVFPFKPGLAGGILIATIDYSFIKKHKGDPVHTTVIPIGISAEFTKFTFNKEISFYNTLLYHKMFEYSREDIHYESETKVVTDYYYHFTSYKLNSIARYNYQKKGYSLFGGAGISLELLKGYWGITKRSYRGGHRYLDISGGKGNLRSIAPAIEAGIRYKSLSLRALFEYNSEGSSAGLMAGFSF